MATRSSSGSWSGAHGADVIDLDKFMRGVRPPRAHRYSNRNELVVDNGGLSRKPPSTSSTGSSSPRVTESTRAPAHAHNKHFSHDSGVSDGSYVKKRSRPHRRYSIAETAGIKAKRESISARQSGTTGSIRAFRVACERTLRDQQRQLARVALLCERLGERRDRSETGPTTKSDSSELSSSSRSTRDPRRKDKSRAQECKTYKIIMSKLDELNRVFAQRRSPAPARRAPSAGSVSVSDKLCATDDRRGGTVVAARQSKKNRIEEPKQVTRRVETRLLVERAVGEMPSERANRSARLAHLQAVNNAYSLDIAPQETVCKLYPNIATESVVKRGSSDEGSQMTLGDPRCGFDLDDPIQLFAQAKRLQALHMTSRMTSRRARSSEPTATSLGRGAARGAVRGSAGGSAGGTGGSGGVSLCARCREYWQALRGYIAAQVCYPKDMTYACS